MTLYLNDKRKYFFERQEEVESLKGTVSALIAEHEDLSLNKNLLEKKVGVLSEEIVSKRRSLEKMQTMLATNYRQCLSKI